MSAATQYLEAAKIEELATELTAAGYKILNNDEDSKYDLVAMKDGKKIAIEVLPRSTLRSAETAENVGRLREEAYKQGYDEFRLVLVSPPRETTVAIDGLEAVLFNEMANHLPQELDELSTHTRLTDVNNVSIKSATVTASDLRVVGLGVVEVELEYDGGEARDGLEWIMDFPFTFEVLLSRDLQLKGAIFLSIDTTSFAQ